MESQANMTAPDADIHIRGFSSFKARPLTDGSISFNGTAKLNGCCYFAMLTVTQRDDGTPRIKLGDYRFETFTGKPVRGAANVKLEELMADAKEVALAWATRYSGTHQPA